MKINKCLFICCGRHFVICLLKGVQWVYQVFFFSDKMVFDLGESSLHDHKVFDRHLGRKKLPTRKDADAERLTLLYNQRKKPR